MEDVLLKANAEAASLYSAFICMGFETDKM